MKHDKDIEYFKEFKAPIMEKLHKDHYTIVNSTIPFYGPMQYFMLRAMGCEQVLEIGVAEGYTSYYLAHGVKDNATRYNMLGNKFYGIDIALQQTTVKGLTDDNLPVELIEMDSMALPGPLAGVTFDYVFQDGCHDEEHVVYEFETMYPQLKGDGKGYWVAHDCFGDPERNAVHGVNKIMQMIKDGKYNMECVRLWGLYGLAVFRKMDK